MMAHGSHYFFSWDFHLNFRTFSPSEFIGSLNQVEQANAPDILYLAGNSDLLSTGRRVAVIGSRQVSNEGMRRARLVVKELVKQKITVVSGLAEGVDTIAHQTAIKEGGQTVAVLGTGLDTYYPSKNRDLQNLILKEYAAVSQFPLGNPISKRNFPMRNRTTALLTDATVIIEASVSSGTRHQGWEGLKLGRDVFLLPNVIENPNMTWANEMLDYGAQRLTRESMSHQFQNLPGYSSRTALDKIAL